mmetsp:Transcript_1291/g.5314  ORF Transcript_1291/g.5314 Transcript_1291/m.5314 type:complete len:278 (+) Transcript_1291:446-1279(+)
MSPYPTVVDVTTAHHTPSRYDVPDSSEQNVAAPMRMTMVMTPRGWSSTRSTGWTRATLWCSNAARSLNRAMSSALIVPPSDPLSARKSFSIDRSNFSCAFTSDRSLASTIRSVIFEITTVASAMPMMMKNSIKIFPASVCGEISPYPTVVTVMAMKYTASTNVSNPGSSLTACRHDTANAKYSANTIHKFAYNHARVFAFASFARSRHVLFSLSRASSHAASSSASRRLRPPASPSSSLDASLARVRATFVVARSPAPRSASDSAPRARLSSSAPYV